MKKLLQKKMINISKLTLVGAAFLSVSAYAQTPPPSFAPQQDDLKAYWGFNGSVEAFPESTTEPNIYVPSTISFQPGVYADLGGQSLRTNFEFNNSNSGFDYAGDEFKVEGDQFAISTWIKYDPVSANMQWIMGYRVENNGIKTSFGLYMSTGNVLNLIASTDNEEGKLVQFTLGPSDINNWIMVSGVYDGANLKLYKNGYVVNQTTLTGNLLQVAEGGLNSFSFGNAVGGANIYRGNLDEAYLYEAALTDEEVLSLYTFQNNVPNYAPKINLHAYWGFEKSILPEPHTFPLSSTQGVSLGEDIHGIDNASLRIDATSTPITGINSSIDYMNVNTNQVTLSAWIKFDPTDFTQTRSWIAGKRGNGTIFFNSYGLLIERTGGPDRVTAALSAIGQNDRTVSFNLEEDDYNTWMMVSMVYNGSNILIYKNGELMGTSVSISGTIRESTTQFAIGGLISTTQHAFNGQIDEVYVYRRPLSAAELVELYEGHLNEIPLGITQVEGELIPCDDVDNDTFELTVETSVDASNLNFTWYNNGELMTDSETVEGTSTQTLSFSSLNEAISGSFICKVSSSNRTLFSNALTPFISGGVLAEYQFEEGNLNNVLSSLNNLTAVGPSMTIGENRFGEANRALRNTTGAGNLAFDTPLSDNTDLTIAMWIKREGGTGFRTLLGVQNNATMNIPYVIDNANRIGVFTSNGQFYNNNTVFPLNSDWVYTVFTTNANGTQIYFDNQLALNLPNTHPGYVNPQTTVFARIGNNQPSTNQAFNGVYDEIKVLTESVTLKEIQFMAGLTIPSKEIIICSGEFEIEPTFVFFEEDESNVPEFQWYKNNEPIEGANSMVLTLMGEPSDEGNYKLVADLNCIKVSVDNISVLIDEDFSPIITVESVDPICEGEEITLTASGANSYVWTGGVENGVPFTPDASTDYTVVGTVNGCESEPITVSVVVNDNPEPIITYDTNTETLSTGEYDSYQWFLNNVIIEGQAGQTVQTTVEGAYKVLVTEEGCEGESEIFNLVTVGVSALDRGFGFTLYPNPANNEVVVNFTSELTEQIELQIFDLAGKQMGTQRINKMVSPIDVSQFAEGVYLFRVLSNNNAKTERVIIKR
jgi:hypothetical protein